MSGYDTKKHFDVIADGYKEEISAHVRDHLINKFWGIVAPYFSGAPRVMDIGCGDGTNIDFFKGKGVNVTGMDFSGALVKSGLERYPSLKGSIFQGSALALPFDDATFDVATMIGVLHHIHSRADQFRAVNEALRAVKKDGVVIIRECNLKNPLFRVFWNYIFPLTAKIDRFGGESWISARRIEGSFDNTVEKVEYFTFLPNFTPGFILPAASRLERVLERSVFRSMAAHYVAVLRKGEGGA